MYPPPWENPWESPCLADPPPVLAVVDPAPEEKGKKTTKAEDYLVKASPLLALSNSRKTSALLNPLWGPPVGEGEGEGWLKHFVPIPAGHHGPLYLPKGPTRSEARG